uniref:NADH-ubiquinone oxidoreductase chain 4L n=1 Tax=Nephotettix cincticeps TaxID=94400 RepID=A0A0E3UQT2_NEPCI|nr:NADH dehydrogenase subunit 4L [Nephotettix cincticeps]AKC91098.1 NADH dehydrogenase subunit 4L [Nephotettix cincticeps]
MFNLFMYMYMFSLISLLVIRKHIFLCLISLEFIVISILMMIMYYSLMYLSSYYLMVIAMVFFVCEGVLGLSVLVNMIRCYSNDYLNSMILW